MVSGCSKSAYETLILVSPFSGTSHQMQFIECPQFPCQQAWPWWPGRRSHGLPFSTSQESTKTTQNCPTWSRPTTQTILGSSPEASHCCQPTQKTKVLKYLIWARKNRQCYAHFRHHTKPKSPGGLAFVTVPNADGMIHPVLDRDEMETTLLEYSRTHFAQAKCSLFTMEPLSHLLTDNGLTPFGDLITNCWQVFNLHHFDEPTKLILGHLYHKLPSMGNHQHTLNYSLLMNGIRKWPKCTTTSPLGQHLGIYKTLQKHLTMNKNNSDTDRTWHQIPTVFNKVVTSLLDFWLHVPCTEAPLEQSNLANHQRDEPTYKD